MYLTPTEVETTLRAIMARSAPGSRLLLLYHRPALLLRIVGPILRLVGEPLRSAWTPDAMRELLARHGFRVVSDEDLATIGGRMGTDVARATRRMAHTRIAVAER
jgi:O-methyltransferase involved in polyketide biosynthesis